MIQKSLKKGRRDFTQRLIEYAIEGGVLTRCKDHPGSIYCASSDLSPAHAIVEAAWKKGEISSDLDGAIDQLDKLIAKAPDRCSHVECWSKP